MTCWPPLQASLRPPVQPVTPGSRSRRPYCWQWDDPGRAMSALRLTLGRWTTRDDIEQAAHQIAAGALVAHSTAIP
jgi:hypothetical protein